MSDNSTVVDHHHVIGELVSLFEVLSGEQHRGPLAHKFLHHFPQPEPRARIKTGGGFIEEKNRWLCYQT